MSEITVLRVRSRVTMAWPQIYELVTEAARATRYPGTTPEKLHAELTRRAGEDKLAILIGLEDGEPKAIAVAMLPTSCMMIAPQVALVYSRGRRARRAVGERLKGWIMAAGYNRVWGVNLWHDDRAFGRVFRDVGEPRRLGSLIEWTF